MSMQRRWQTVKNAEVNFKFDEQSKEIEGYYINVQEGLGQNGNSTVHTIKTTSGFTFSFWGTNVLNDLLSKVDMGSYTRIEYKGRIQGKNKSMQPYHNFEVMFDPEDVIKIESDLVDSVIPENTKSTVKNSSDALKQNSIQKQAKETVVAEEDPFSDDPFKDEDDLNFN